MNFITAIITVFALLLSMFHGFLPPVLDDFINGNDTVIEENMTPEQLQEKYSFCYYDNFTTAMLDVNGNTIGENDIDVITSPETEALAGVYINDEGEINVVALADNYVQSTISVYKDVTINLGGHTIFFNMTKTGFDVRNTTEAPDDIVTVNINGRVDGGQILVEFDNAAAVVNRADTVVNVDEGVYVARSECCDVDENHLGTNGKKYQTRVFYSATGSELNIINAEILTSAHCGNAYGIVNYGNLNIENTRIFADAEYSDDGNDYIYMSNGIQNSGVAIVKNCDITGTHSGISSRGTLFVDGGTYQSIGHGGVYVSGNSKTSYIQNAILRECEYEGAYNVSPETSNYAGFYIGGGSGQDNLVVYMDNCEVYGTKSPIVLRGTSGEQNNTLYISNSEILGDSKIRIDNDTHTLYSGKGNNFTADNTTRPYRVVVTEDVYHTGF